MLFTSYILKVSITLVMAYLFYFLFLRKTTFYAVNRWYFLLMIVSAFLLPLFDFSVLFGPDIFYQPEVNIFPDIAQLLNEQQPVTIESGKTANLASDGFKFTTEFFLLFIYFSGCIYFLSRLLYQLLFLKREISAAKFITQNRYSFYHLDLPIAPFSFFGRIYLNRNRHTAAELSEIFVHETAHIEQFHSFDNLIAELLCIVCWFNPVAWLLKPAIKQNLEYIADRITLESGCDPEHYQYHLLKVTGIAPTGFTPGFTISFLKKRIIMINKKPSSRLHLAKFILIVPLVFILMTAFNKPDVPNPPSKVFTDTIPARLAAKKQLPLKKLDNVSHLPENVASIEKQGANTLVRFVNGDTETYDLSRQSETKKFIKKFGTQPVALESVSTDLPDADLPAKDKTNNIKIKGKSKETSQIMTDQESSKDAVVNIGHGTDDIHAIRMQGDKVIIDTIPGYIAKDKKLLKKWLKRYGY